MATFDHGEAIYRQLEEARENFGAARLKMGAAMALIQEHGLWKGRGESWSAFLADHRIHPSAARDFIAIARTFVLNPEFAPATDEERDAVASASVKVLKRAIAVMTLENRDEIYAIVSELGNLDALEAMRTLQAQDSLTTPVGPNNPRDRRVSSLLNQFYALPMDVRLEALAHLQQKKTGT